MQTKLDEAKAELLARAARVAENSPVGGHLPTGATSEGESAAPAEDTLLTYLQRYYLHTAPEDLADRDPVDIFGAALSHYRLAEERPQGTANVRVHTPTVEENGWTCSHSVVEVVTDDMPFLVDSVTNELSRQNRGIHVVIHPQVTVRRDVTGKLIELLPEGAKDGSHDTLTESWIHVEIDRETDRSDLKQITLDLVRVLSDVREAVEDWEKMREAALRIADELPSEPTAADLQNQEVEEARELLRWLAADHFTFLGYREYHLNEDDSLGALPGTGLGVLRADPHHTGEDVHGHPVSPSFNRLPADARAKAREHRLLVLTKANSRATVHRPSYLDYVGVKKFDDEGNVVGERRFLGLFSSAAYTESVRRVPVIRRKVAEVLKGAGFSPNSHDGRDLLQILETYPRDELFQTPPDELRAIVTSVLYLQERRRLRLYLRKDEYGRYYSALVYLPRDRYTTGVRLRIIDILKEELQGASVDFTAWNTESILSRLHFVVRVKQGTELPELTDADTERIEARLVDAARSWADGFAEALNSELGEERAAALLRKYAGGFPEGYKADHNPRAAVADLTHLEQLAAEGKGFALSLYEPVGAGPGERRFKIYRDGGQVSLSAVLPVLQKLGCEVVDERPYELRRSDRSTAWIYDFGLRMPKSNGNGDYLADDARERFQQAFAAVWTGQAENDGFNSLVLAAGLTWRQAMVVRAYAKYLRQAGSKFSQDYMEDTLHYNVHTTRLLVSLFEARMSPDRQRAGTELIDGLLEEVDGALDQVASLDEDRILRSFLTVIKATLRTNFFQEASGGVPHSYVSMKFDPQAIPDLPAPRPAFEIWVYSPRVEGVHLRFGKVARGGLRWSDRREDFRTEILGLVKAQMVKNTVIVPVGAKGGFVAKQLPDPAKDRDAWLAEGVASYKMFISALLDITDNMVGGEIVPPADVVRHDEDDTYLVVAADKGTATFSDIANKVAESYNFWLGDAFASGGSAGYDHKGMGITARGAWESVKRHFRELGHDSQTEDFTAAGVGDMSGDVFGNGMLLSEHIRLVAAFDHRHIFIDPTPDAAVSYAERRRLFELPRSSWADYNKDLLSAGGGIHPRSAKSIPVNAQMREALGIEGSVSKMTPAELMQAILESPVDLLWNGGIGTYVKASTESHADVGDKANDAIRVDGADLRAKVVGEGGNLGLTQLGRIEFAQHGGRINTDAIDNSAGVDTSDHEVNIKILLNAVVSNGDLTVKQRNKLLAEMTDEVGRLVLRNNYAQNTALANALAQSSSMVHAQQRFMRTLVREGDLDRALEFLPTDRQIRERLTHGHGLTQPETAVLLAYTKITVADALLSTDLPDDPYLQRLLHAYFPKQLHERYTEQIDGHALRREIVTTVLVNDTVNAGGTSFLHRMREETGASLEEVVRAHTAAREIFGLGSVWDAVEALDTVVPADVQTRIRLHSRRLVERGTRWLLNNRPQPLELAETIGFFSGGVRQVWSELPSLLRGADLEWYQQIRDELTGAGVTEELAQQVAGFSSAFPTLDNVLIADNMGKEPMAVAEVYYDLADRLGITQLMDRISALPRTDRWQSMARAAIREDLYAAHAALTADVLAAGGDSATPEQRYKAWEQQNAAILGRAKTTLDEIQGSEDFDLANLSVAMRTMRTLLRTHS
ncbi:NAD-specific glutamate dehydrogenase [Streptomyces sp. YIM 130001]|uniref:NAD-glutamate dehydrogenase n=1 Tax=Streptomyces sp. YIM 130001 TaxID=2259644 RepID=UPI000E64B7C4|nr:NAD-glutamate dehydrogenase [Streptomyces sp. YIM 130001]RII19863.1 NAD-specific glutamate dehydrogenase [Streptomyces sp. YIM 130001]